MSFDISVVKSGDAAVVQLCGELDASTAPRLDELLASLADEGVRNVTLELADLDFIDSTGVRTFVLGLKRLRQQGGDLGLRSPRPSTRKVLEITGLTSLFRVEEIKGAGPSTSRSEPAPMSTGR